MGTVYTVMVVPDSKSGSEQLQLNLKDQLWMAKFHAKMVSLNGQEKVFKGKYLKPLFPWGTKVCVYGVPFYNGSGTIVEYIEGGEYIVRSNEMGIFRQQAGCSPVFPARYENLELDKRRRLSGSAVLTRLQDLTFRNEI